MREVADHARAGGSHSTIGDWFAGRGLPSPSSLDLFRAVLAACGVEGAEQTGPWLAGWRRARAATVRRASGPEPYRGLSAYQSEDADWYFGRSALVEALLARLAALAGTGGVQLVVGVSGAGKSSLLRAMARTTHGRRRTPTPTTTRALTCGTRRTTGEPAHRSPSAGPGLAHRPAPYACTPRRAGGDR